jgi:Uri superfamily endonuclease
MKINREKTEVMIVAKQEVKARVFVKNRELKQTTEFTYLGSAIASNDTQIHHMELSRTLHLHFTP